MTDIIVMSSGMRVELMRSGKPRGRNGPYTNRKPQAQTLNVIVDVFSLINYDIEPRAYYVSYVNPAVVPRPGPTHVYMCISFEHFTKTLPEYPQSHSSYTSSSITVSLPTNISTSDILRSLYFNSNKLSIKCLLRAKPSWRAWGSPRWRHLSRDCGLTSDPV